MTSTGAPARRTILVAVAWPYASGSRHVGHLAGAYLPADIFARFQRLRGHRVLMVSGSDAHGTPITVRADREGVTPRELVERYHAEFQRQWKTLQIDWDLYTSTMTDNHERAAQDIFRRLRDKGYIERRATEQFYDPKKQQFLPDRYIEGTCPHCGDRRARGDQCDACGTLLDVTELVEPRSAISGALLELRTTEHDFFRLSVFADALRDWIDTREEWRPFVKSWSLGMIDGGLADRAVTRDLTWGVPIPDEPVDSTKRIYVWFEAVVGYLSASIEWASRQHDPDLWKQWWVADNAESFYFIGKDNIPFHSIIWPAMLLAYGELNLPTAIPANHYATTQGSKASSSQGIGLSIDDALARYQPDALRYALAALLPERTDTAISVGLLDTKIETELVATWGNLTHRLLMMAWRWHGQIPVASRPLAVDHELTDTCAAALEQAGALIDQVSIRSALRTMFSAAHAVNSYLSDQEPWNVRITDQDRADTILRTGLDSIATIAVGLSPFLPVSSKQLLETLGVDITMNGADQWVPHAIETGRELSEPNPLFSQARESKPAASVGVSTAVVKSELDAELVPVADFVVEGTSLFHAAAYEATAWDELDAIIEGARLSLEAIHAGYRTLRDTLGVGWRKRIPAPIALHSRFGGGQPEPAHTIVDFYNRVSMLTGLALGLHDLDRLAGDAVTLGVAMQPEAFTSIGGRQDSVAVGEYFYADADGPVCRLEVVQCARTAVSEQTTRYLFIFQGNPIARTDYVVAVRNWTLMQLEHARGV